MSQLTAGSSWSYDDLNFHGLSLSGIRTSMAMPDLQIAFDVAQGFPYLFPIRKFFLTHGHMDHAAGVPYLISQKNLYHMPPPEIYMPPSLMEPLQQIIHLWEKIEDHKYRFVFQPITGEDIELNHQNFIRPFPTFHRIESFGYTLFKKTKKLSEAFINKDKSELIAAKNAGIPIHDEIETPLFSFTGDTKIEFLMGRDWIRKSKVLMLEATYLDNKKTVENAREWGHTHLDEIIPLLDEIESERIVLIHISSRYTLEQAQRIVLEKIPKKHHDRVVVFPGR